MKDLVAACYLKFLGRAPADTEAANWLVSAATNGWTGKDLVARIGGSKEAKDHAKK